MIESVAERSWVAEDMAERLRSELGAYHWSDWERFAVDHDIEVYIHRVPTLPDGFSFGRAVFARRQDTEHELAQIIWHELSHIVALPINAPLWESRPGGVVMVRKVELRANVFARRFPSWD